MHCTGTTFYEVAKQELLGRVLLSSTGTRFTLGVRVVIGQPCIRQMALSATIGGGRLGRLLYSLWGRIDCSTTCIRLQRYSVRLQYGVPALLDKKGLTRAESAWNGWNRKSEGGFWERNVASGR